tara:strand:+ start:42 stop:224 length:183 start_codon:yes stop_codon:yes gene_type:complete
MKLVPRNFRGMLFVVLAILNAGVASFFVAAGAIEQAAFSGITAFLCCAVWFSDVYRKQED